MVNTPELVVIHSEIFFYHIMNCKEGEYRQEGTLWLKTRYLCSLISKNKGLLFISIYCLSMGEVHWKMRNFGGGQQHWEKGAASQLFQMWQLWVKMSGGKASPQLPLSSYLFPFLENCTRPQRKIVVTSVSAEILSIPNFITLYIYPASQGWII